MVISFTLRKSVCPQNFIFFTYQVIIIIIKIKIINFSDIGSGSSCSQQPSSEDKAGSGSACNNQGAVTQHIEQQSSQHRDLLTGLGSSWEVKSTGQVQISRYVAAHMHSYVIAGTRTRIQGSSWAKLSFCLLQLFLTGVPSRTIQQHQLFIYVFVVPSPSFSVYSTEDYVYRIFQYHKSSHVHSSSLVSLNMFLGR